MSVLRFVSVFALVSVASLVACDGDDDLVADDDTTPTNDASTNPDSTVPPKDSGSDAASDAAACNTCGQIILQGQTADACEVSQQHLMALIGCACAPEACAADCNEECVNNIPPGDTCGQCLQVNCQAEVAACIQDDGVTPLPTTDGGTDGGETDGGETDGGETDGGETDGGETDAGE